jgi:hypothetical protein
MKNDTAGYLIAILIVALIAILVAPLFLIWALNTLFGLGIAYGFFEWLAALLIIGFFKQPPIKVNNSK